MRRPKTLFLSLLWFLLFFGVRAVICVAVSLSAVNEKAIDNILSGAAANAPDILFLCNIITPVLLFLTVKLGGEKFMRSAGLQKTGILGVLAALVFGLVLTPVLRFVLDLIPIPDIVSGIYEKTAVAAVFKNAELSVITTVVLIPLCEELVFRGMILHTLDRSFSTFTSIILTTLLYTVIFPDPAKALYAFVTGLIFCLFCLRFHSLWPSLLAHIAMAVVSEYFDLSVFQNGLQYAVLALCAAAVFSLGLWMLATGLSNYRKQRKSTTNQRTERNLI